MEISIKGIRGKDFIIDPNDRITVKLCMLIEGRCTIGIKAAAEKYGYTEQRFHQLMAKYNQGGAQALADKKRGSENKRVRTRDVLSQIIRLRFLDPLSNSSVIAQKLKQTGYKASRRSVERTITEYGLQKKTPID